MFLQFRRVKVVLAALCAGLLLCIAAGQTMATAADWFQSATPAVTKGLDYDATTTLMRQSMDCRTQVLPQEANTSVCSIDTYVGPVTTDGKLLVDGHQYRLTDSGQRYTVLPVPNAQRFIAVRNAPGWGAYIYQYDQLTRADVERKVYFGVPFRTQYEIQKPISRTLSDSSGQLIQAGAWPLAFSQNGDWMLVDIPNTGVFRVNRDMTELVPFSVSTEQMAGRGTAVNSFAISNDGKLAAASGGLNLFIYKLEDCTQRNFTYGVPVNLHGCKSRNVGQGLSESGQKVDEGLLSQIPNGSIFGNLRFVNDDNIRFDAKYRTSASDPYSTSSYIATAPGGTLHGLGLLGMGDSYISGEGINMYREGTDTNENKCHLSDLSYPYLLGENYFDSYESVACSGAIIKDVDGY
jgi:hypothetical protein